MELNQAVVCKVETKVGNCWVMPLELVEGSFLEVQLSFGPSFYVVVPPTQVSQFNGTSSFNRSLWLHPLIILP